MATLPELEAAFTKADQAAQRGDAIAAQDAKAFADEIRRVRSTPAPATRQPRIGAVMSNSGPLMTLTRDGVIQPETASFGTSAPVKMAADVGLEAGGATGGALVGAMFPPPFNVVTIPAGAVVGGVLGNLGAQERRVLMGEQEKINPGEAAGSGVANLVPGAGGLNAARRGVGRLALEGAKQAGAGLAGKATETLVDAERFPTGTEAALATVLPAVGGVAAQRIQSGSPITQAAVSSTLTDNDSVARATLERAKRAGYVVPPATVNPSLTVRATESLSGKGATERVAVEKNQEVTNRLAKEALGLPENRPITVEALDAIRKDSAKPYAEIEALSTRAQKRAEEIARERFTAPGSHELAVQMSDPDTLRELNPLLIQAQADIMGLREARNKATSYYRAYGRSARPEDLEAARSFEATAEELENRIEQAVEIGGKPELLTQLRDARALIAKTYDVENALNTSNGNVSAPAIRALQKKDRPLSGPLLTIADFTASFPTVSREAERLGSFGVSRGDIITGALLGAGTTASTGSPLGLLAATAPFISREALLSRPGQAALANFPAPFVAPDPLAEFTRRAGQAAGGTSP